MVPCLVVSAHSVNTCASPSLLDATFSPFLCFLMGISLFKMVPKHRAEMLSGAPEHEKAVAGLVEKTHVLDELPPGVSCSPVGHQFTLYTV